jgi:8-oxo-dGTP diphosphatase
VNKQELPATPRVGVGVIVLRDGQVLLGKRKGSHGAGTWALPGGHLEFGESVEACAARETKEETGLQIQVMGYGPYTNDVMPNENKHYVTVFVLARGEQGTPEVREPEKCEGWSWFRWSELPSNLFLPLRNLISQGYTPMSGRADG